MKGLNDSLISLFWQTPKASLRDCLCFLPGGCKFTLQKGINLLRYDASFLFSIFLEVIIDLQKATDIVESALRYSHPASPKVNILYNYDTFIKTKELPLV